MVPTFSLRIQAMLRSMLEVVIPAIPRDQALANDQARIILGNLQIMAEQGSRTYKYEFVELKEYAQLVRSLCAAAERVNAAESQRILASTLLAEVGWLEALALPSEAELSELVVKLKLAADGLVKAAYVDTSGEFRQVAEDLVIEQSEKQILRDRRWFARAGFEPEPDNLPNLDTLLN